MALEIERRFLVDGDGWRQHVRWRARLEQGYLLASPEGLTLRVRRTAHGLPEPRTEAWLTLKAPPAATMACGGREGAVRQEFEYPIPADDALALLALAPQQLAKWRHGLDLAGGDWVVDVFEGDNAPLVVAEVELEHPDQHVVLPSWCRAELTGRHQFSNAALARHPLARWSPAERAALPDWFPEIPVASDTIN